MSYISSRKQEFEYQRDLHHGYRYYAIVGWFVAAAFTWVDTLEHLIFWKLVAALSCSFILFGLIVFAIRTTEYTKSETTLRSAMLDANSENKEEAEWRRIDFYCPCKVPDCFRTEAVKNMRCRYHDPEDYGSLPGRGFNG